MHEQVSQGEGCAEYLRADCGALPARGGGQTWGDWQARKGLAPGKGLGKSPGRSSRCLTKRKTAIKIPLPSLD